MELTEMQKQQDSKSEFACLYTKHKTQKRKVWNDGRLIVLQSSALLHDANPVPGSSDPVLDQCELSKDQRQVLLTSMEMVLEGEKFLIEVEGEWRPPSLFTSKTKLAARKMSLSIKKKFKMPPPYIPSTSNNQEGTRDLLKKRKRPLQPGELARMHRREAPTSNPSLPPKAYLRQSQQRNPTRNQHGFENRNGNLAINRDSSRFSAGHDVFLRSSPQEDARLQHILYASTARKSLNVQRISTNSPEMPRNMATSNLLEHEEEANVSNHSSPRPDTGGSNTKDRTVLERSGNSTLASNDFDEGNFYGLEEENEGQNYVSTEGIDGATSKNHATNSNLSVFPQRESQFLPAAGPTAQDVSNRDNTVSDNALLAMFGAASTDQNAREARQAPSVEEQLKFDQTKFILPSQSSSEEEDC